MSVCWLAVLEVEYPTAKMLFAEIATTPLRTLSPVPTFGLLMVLQAEPFHCSMSVWSMTLLLLTPETEYPTARTLFEEMAATPLRVSPIKEGLALLTMRQVPLVAPAASARPVSANSRISRLVATI